MGRNEHALSRSHGHRDRVMPVGQEARDRVLEAFGPGELFVAQRRIAGVTARITRVVERQGRRSNVVAAAPHVGLFKPVALDRLGLVQALQRAVVPLVETPAPMDGNPHQVHLFENQPQGLDSPREHRGIGEVEGVPFLLEHAAGLDRFLDALVGEANVGPASKAVLFVPDALAVSQ